jgi:uncharacterized protein DUF2442/2-oxoacid dehydrogenase-like protein with E3 subunit-binding domain
MITSAANHRIKDIRITDDELVVALADGRTLAVPLVWYPRLLNASVEQRNDWQLIGDGEGVHWPQIDEDLSAAGMLGGVPAPPVRSPSASVKKIGDQSMRVAQDFYDHSLGQLKGQLQGDRSQLESLAEQIPQEEAQAQIQEMVDSYTAIENSLDQVAQALGIEEAVNQAAQQGQETAGQATYQAQDAVGQVTDQATGAVGGVLGQAGQAAQGVQDTAGQAAGQVQDTAGQEAAGGAAQQAQGIAGEAAQQAQDTAGQATQQAQGAAGGGWQEETNATDAARRKAQELGVDLSQIEGSGPSGRITVKDVLSSALPQD